tara:strand:+ start:3263 stop:4966 length:1704 start_codon:yes stop_codon:yes gene_type:complete
MNKDYTEFTNEELIDHLNESDSRLKKITRQIPYGLVWEDKDEKVESQLDTKIPLIKINRSKEIKDKKRGLNYLIEGENLHVLKILEKTHFESIDVIYIDPPYNTGNKDFIFNDEYVDKEDLFRHSKWVSFMEKRLKIAKTLLKANGKIIVSIDDNEVFNLKLLLDQIFNEDNFIACLPTVMNLKGNQDQFAFAGTHEYTLIYTKDKKNSTFKDMPLSEQEIKEDWKEDEFGLWKEGRYLKFTGKNASREIQPSLYFPVWVKKDGTDLSTKETKGWDKVLPITIKGGKPQEMSWSWSKKKFEEEKYNIIIKGSSPDWSFKKKQRPNIGEVPSKRPKSLFYKPEYSSTNGATQLEGMFGDRVFDYPKPLGLIEDLLLICGEKDALFLDFFAGTGTTGHAILNLNKNDNGNRRFILVSNNENKIVENVTYSRLSKAIKGYKNLTTNKNVEKLGGALKKLDIHYVENENTDFSNYEISKNLNDTICFKEETYELVKKNNYFEIYKNWKGKYTIIIFEFNKIHEIPPLIKEADAELTIYKYELADDFDEYVFEEIFKNFKILDQIDIPTFYT